MLAAPAVAQTPSAITLESPAAAEKAGTPPQGLSAGANSFAEGQARTLLQEKGYAEVSPLVNDRQGIWHGTAKKGQSKVSVSVDFQGHVAEH